MKKGEKVHWSNGASEAEGKITAEFTEPVEKTIKGAKVKRNASKEDPAYTVKQDNGTTVLHSGKELKKGAKTKK